MGSLGFEIEDYECEYPTMLFDIPSVRSTTSNSAAPTQPDAPAEDGMIFFIPGNPGLPQYYTVFFDLLRDLLPSWRIVCASQAGCYTLNTYSKSENNDKHSRFYNLDDQISHKILLLKEFAKKYDYINNSQKKIVLIGHSLGCWLLQRLVVGLHSDNPGIKITSAILLFPTIRSISESPHGLFLTRILKYLPRLPVMGSTGSNLLSKLPLSTRRTLIKYVMKNPPEHAVESTDAMISSSGVVYQVLQLAKEEMEKIDEEGQDIISLFWDGTYSSSPLETADDKINIILYFAQEDHWVGSHTRNEIIEAHSSRDNVTVQMATDEDNCSHSFCINDNEIMANHVSEWISNL
ncbi:hypothetical protein V1511DRAFT_520699 [Dipodascopsis uninucleata]